MRFDPSPGAWIRGIDDLRRGIEQLEDAFACGHGCLQDVVLVAEVLNGAPEALGIHVECCQHADGDGAGEDAETAAPDDERNGDGRQDFDCGVIECVGEDRVLEGDHVQAVDCFEVLVSALFAIEELDNGHAADVFLREAVDAGDGGADAAVALANTVAEEARNDEDQRQNGKRQQRQPPVNVEHHDGHDGEGEEVVDDGQDPASEHFVDGVDVGRNASDESTNCVRIEEADVHALHVAEDVAAQVEHDFLAGPLHQVCLNELEEIRRDLGDQEDQCESSNARYRVSGQMSKKEGGRSAFVTQDRGARAAFSRGKVAVDADHHEVWPRDIAHGFQRDGDGGDCRLQPVRAQVMSEALDKAGVVDLANRIFIGFWTRIAVARIAFFRLGLAGFLLSVGHRLTEASRFHCTGCGFRRSVSAGEFERIEFSWPSSRIRGEMQRCLP